MATSIADLAVNISTNIASLETGMAKAADVISRTATNFERSFSQLENKISGFIGSVQGIAAAIGIALSAKVFEDFITGSIDAQASLVNLATRMGTTASAMSALIPSAKLSGTSLDDVATASDRFSKNLIDLQNGVGKSDKAFKALGFSEADAARFLKDPAQGLLELGQHLNQFADDGSKSAAVMLLLGRGGQQLLPMLKLLGEQTSLVSRVTDEQAAAAKALTDEWNMLRLRGDELKNVIAAGLAPSLTNLLKAFMDATAGPKGLGQAIKDFANDGTLGIWASNVALWVASVIDWLSRVPKYLDAVAAAGDVAVFSIKVAMAAAGGDAYALIDAYNAKTKAQADFGAKWSAANAQQTSDLVKNLQAQNAALKMSRDIYNTFGMFHTTTGPTPSGPKPSLNVPSSIGQASAPDLTKQIEEYQKALAAVAKASTDAQAKFELQGVANSQLLLKQQYDLGIMDYQHYWDSKIALEKTAFEISKKQLQDDVNTQAALVATLQATVDKIDQSNFKDKNGKLDQNAYMKALYDGTTKGLLATAELRKAQGALNAEIEKGQTIGTNYAELLSGKLSEAMNEYSLVLKGVTTAQGFIDLAQQTGQITELDAINQKASLAQASIAELNKKLAEYQALANDPKSSGPIKADAIQKVKDMTLQIAQLAAASDVLAAKFRDIFESGFSTFITDLISGTKTIKQAFLDMAKSIEKSISDIAAKNIAETLFGKSGALGGIPDFFAGLFGGKSGGGVGGAAGPAALGTASTTTALALTSTLIPAIEATAVALASMGAGSAVGAAGSIVSTFGNSFFDSSGVGVGFGAAAASGTDFATGGMTLVGEHGPEMVNIPRGAQIIPNDVLAAKRNAKAGDSTFHINVNVLPGASRASAEQAAAATAREIQRARRIS